MDKTKLEKAIKSMMDDGIDAGAYAVQEAWDVQTANQAMSLVASLIASEQNEPDDLAKLTAILQKLSEFVAGEIADMNPPQPAAEIASITPDELIAYGGEIKAVGGGKIQGVLIRRTTKDDPDLTKDYFGTESDVRFPKELDTYYNHGLDGTLKKRVIGVSKLTAAENGDVWAETQLNMRDEYEKAIYAMAEKGKLGYSSGALSHLVERTPEGKGVWMIKTWPIGEVSLTPTPAEPRNIVSIKSLISSQAALPDVDVINKQTKQKGENEMEENIKSAIDSAVAAALKKHDDELKAAAEKAAELKAAEEKGYKAAVEELEKKGQIKKVPAYIKNLESDSDDGVGAFKSWLATGEHNSELIQPRDVEAWSNTKAAFNVTTGASGAYLVPDPLYNRIIAKRQLMSWVRQAPVQAFSTPADHILVPVEATSATNFVLTTEAGAYDENEPTVNQVDLILYKYTKLVKVSEEFLAYQGTNFDQWIADVFARAEATTENTIYTTGSGVGEPLGINTSAGATDGNTVTTSGALTPNDLTALVGNLGAGYIAQGQTGFLMKNKTKWYAKGLSNSNYFAFINTPSNGPTTYPNVELTDGFLGQPAYISDDMDDYTVGVGGHSVIFGNFNYYGIVEKPGLLIQRNPYLYMANGQVGLFATMYRGGATLQKEAIYRTVGK